MTVISPARLRGAGRIGMSLVITLVLAALVVWAMGASPADAASAIWQGVVGSPYTIGQTISIAAVLVLMGLAVLIPFNARLFNVGGEGQLFAGAIGAVTVALTLGDGPVTLLLALLVGMAAGTLWALIPGVLRALLGASEMIVSLLLNFVATYIAVFVVTRVFPDTSGQSTRFVPPSARLPVIWQEGGVTIGVILVLLAVVGVWIIMSHTRLGFGIRAIGMNPDAAALSGFSATRTSIITFALGGACAGLAAAFLVLGMFGLLTPGISASYGFLGVVVALIAGGRVVWVPPVALLIAALSVGSNRLQVAVQLPFTMGIVVVGVLVLTLLATGAISLRSS